MNGLAYPPTTMKIQVNLEHIKKGQRMRGNAWLSPNHAERECPIAQAVREHFPNARVSTLCIVPDGNLRGHYHMLPPEAQEFVKEFDVTGQGRPFQFDLGELVYHKPF